MIKITAVRVTGDHMLDLTFSDGSAGKWSADDLIERNTVLTAQLADLSYFARAFIEGGALAWPNGLELSPAALHARLDETRLFGREAA